MFAEKDKLLAQMQTRRAFLMMAEQFPAAQLYEEVMQVVKHLSNIPRGEPGKMPQLGKDYLTTADVKKIIDAISAQVRVPANGKTPVAGTDYPTHAQTQDMIKAAVAAIPAAPGGYTPRRGVDFWTSADVDIMANTVLERLSGEEIVAKLMRLVGEKRLDASALKNLPDAQSGSYLPELEIGGARRGSGGGSSAMQVLVNGVNIGQDIKKVNFVGAGVTAVRAGDGNAEITITGGSGANIATETVAAVQSGSDVTLALAGLAHTMLTFEFVTRNGQVQPSVSSAPADGSSGYKLVGTTLTVYNADPSETFLVCYTY